MNDYGKVRVATADAGLVCVALLFDAVEVEPMISSFSNPEDLVPAIDDRSQPPIAYSVRAHYRAGGVDTIADYRFAPDTPDREKRARDQAFEHAFSLADMIMMSDPDLRPHDVLGPGLSGDERAGWVRTQASDDYLEQECVQPSVMRQR